MLHIKSKVPEQAAKREFDDLMQRYALVQSRLEKIRQLFDNETDADCIESLIYEEKALMIRLDHLIRKIKEASK